MKHPEEDNIEMDKILILETDRLILRRFCEADLKDLFEYLSDDEVVRYEPYKTMCLDEVKDNLSWRISTDEMIAVELKSNGKLIGNVYLGKRDFDSFEMGYVFNKQFWKKGYAKESCEAVIRKIFSEGGHRIYAECDPCNESSWRLLESLQFEREAYHKQNVYFWKDENDEPIWKDTYVYAILNNHNN